MNQEFPTIAVTPVREDVYRVYSAFDKDSVALTAQTLRATFRNALNNS